MPHPNNCLRYWDLADHIRIGRNWPGNCCPGTIGAELQEMEETV